MERWKEDFLFFCKNKIYRWMLSLTAVFSYGFLVTHQTVGIDDTPYTYYFEDGLNVIVGRWFMYVLNKVFHVADFSPFITDLAGVLILILAVTVWCTLIYSICRQRIPLWGYVFFSCIFLSCPLISEVYTYYLHNGVSFGYLFVGISLLFFKGLVESLGGKLSWKRLCGTGLGTAFFLFVAMGCYESFMIVWLVGVLMTLLLMRYMGQPGKVFLSLVAGALAAVVAIVFRSVMIPLCTAVFDLGAMQDEAVQRSIGEMLGWMFEPGAMAEFNMAIKRMYVMYFVFACAYYPIMIFVWASVFMVIFAIWRTIRQKDLWIGVLTVGIFIASFLLVVIEGSATLYRAAQFLPVICALGGLVLSYAVSGKTADMTVGQSEGEEKASAHGRVFGGAMYHRALSGVVIFALSAVLWNQCYEMNRWFYVDWMKYEDAKNVAEQVARKLEENFDTSKPVVFTGYYLVPKSIIEDAYVNYNTETYYRMRHMTDWLDPDLLDKFNRGEYGVWMAQTPALSVVDWGITAFDTDEELVKFFAMHGYNIVPNRDKALYEEMSVLTADYPHFPQEGSIVDMGDCIVVHF